MNVWLSDQPASEDYAMPEDEECGGYIGPEFLLHGERSYYVHSFNPSRMCFVLTEANEDDGA